MFSASPYEAKERNQRLNNVIEAMTLQAFQVAILIIAERSLPDAEKSIPPLRDIGVCVCMCICVRLNQ